MKKYRIKSIALILFSVLMINTVPVECLAKPTTVNTNKNSIGSEKYYSASRKARVTLIRPDGVSDDNNRSVSEAIIKEGDVDIVSENTVSEDDLVSSLSMNDIKYSYNSPKYKNIQLLHLPYDEYMRINAEWFYRDGMYDRQGVNSFNYNGTCSEAAEATVMNRLFNTNAYTENNILACAGMLSDCNMGSDPTYGGAQSAVQMVDVFNHIGDVTGDKVEANYLTNGFVPKPERTAELLVSGNQIIMSVAPCVLWDYPREESIAAGIDYWSPNHWIVVTAPKYDKKGKIEGFYIMDSSGYGQNYLTLSKYKNCVWGPTGREVYNQACVIIKKKANASMK